MCGRRWWLDRQPQINIRGRRMLKELVVLSQELTLNLALNQVPWNDRRINRNWQHDRSHPIPDSLNAMVHMQLKIVLTPDQTGAYRWQQMRVLDQHLLLRSDLLQVLLIVVDMSRV